jgi:hypothetical protein
MDQKPSKTLLLRRRLEDVGLSGAALNAAWPSWWSDAAEASPSANAELRFSLARKLGLDPRSLLDDNDTPKFVWRDEARFKHLRTDDEHQISAITSFGTALAALLLTATPASETEPGFPSAAELRTVLLTRQPFVRLTDLLSVAWTFGIPVVHLRVFPAEQKRMAAMTVHARNRDAILIGREAVYPPYVAFHLAHEIAHIFLGHLRDSLAIVDMESELGTEADAEELEADQFALEVLTGTSEPVVLPRGSGYSASQLAANALEHASELRIEPGTLALCFGFSTKDWATANAALHKIYSQRKPVWSEINQLARRQLNFSALSEDNYSYVSAVLGGSERQ